MARTSAIPETQNRELRVLLRGARYAELDVHIPASILEKLEFILLGKN